MENKKSIAFGIHAVEALLENSTNRISEMWIQNNARSRRLTALITKCNAIGIPVKFYSKEILNEKTFKPHQGVVAHVKSAPVYFEKDLDNLLDNEKSQPLLLILDCVTDPHNLGACLRSANAAGATAVITTKNNAAPINPTVSKVACGAAEYTPIITVTNLARTMRNLKKRGIWIYGTAIGDHSLNIFATDISGPMALVLGAEDKGLRRLTTKECDYLVQIPMTGNVKSLNISVAAGICLFEVVRQRGTQQNNTPHNLKSS